MTLLIAGLALWYVSHLLKRLAPGLRQALGDARGKMLATVLALAALVLMILGYRAAPFEPVYTPVAGMGHLNNTLMLVSLFLFGVGGTKGTLFTRMRHPMLWGAVIWAVAHLLVNGDAASLVLFGGIGLWALVEMVAINAAGPWVRPLTGRGVKGDLMNLVGTLVLYGAIAGIHSWLGYNPFLGTYG